MARVSTPSSQEQLAAELGEAGAAGVAVRFRGAGTKLSWAVLADFEPTLELSTAGLTRIVEHNAGDLTAVLEAGVPLAEAQRTFASEGQMLALDPPAGATVGGAVASGDSGPLRARYGGVRDLVLGMTVGLSDGTRAKAGGKVIKNVAGYDLAKLFAGSLGTLGAILEVAVRLHPVPPTSATAVGRSADPDALAGAASAVGHAPLEYAGLDVRWEDGTGAVLARFGGAAPRPQAAAAAEILRAAGLDVEVADTDAALWHAQRDAQHARVGEPDTVARVSALQSDLPDLLRTAARTSASLVGRAALGLSWLRWADPGDAATAIAGLRRRAIAVVLDAPPEVHREVDPWGPRDEAALALMRRVKQSFDPAGVCAPGVLL